MTRLTALALSVVALMLLFGGAVSVVDAATPTPTLYIVPPKPNSFPVPTGAPPWPTPALPTYPPLTPSPTLYNATAIHATDYPNQVSTATAQVGQFHEPIDAISTPVAALVAAPGTPDAGDLDTGINIGQGNITMLGWADEVSDGIGDTIANAKGFITQTWDFLSYSPALQGLIMAEFVTLVIALFVPVIALIIRAAKYVLTVITILRIVMRIT